MKRIVTLVTSVSREDATSGWQAVARAYVEPLAPVEVTVSPFGMVTEFVFDYHPTQLDELQTTLGRFGISGSIYERREYEGHELLESEFLELRTGLDVDSVVGTLKWDLMPICSHCGFRETRYILPMIRVKTKPQGYQLAKVDYHPKVVSAALARELRDAHFTGAEFVPLGVANSPNWYALALTYQLLSMQSPPTRLRRLRAATPLCERNHNLEAPDSELFYQRKGFGGLDFNYTYEIFGDSETTGRRMVISNRVYRLLVELGVEKLECEPVRFVD